MHLAAAAGAPTLGLFGPSDDRRYRPWAPQAAYLRTPESRDALFATPGFDHRTTDTLMDGLTVDAVDGAARDLFRRTAAQDR
jgi:ADP-heptose:LPS heptosyltransferase